MEDNRKILNILHEHGYSLDYFDFHDDADLDALYLSFSSVFRENNPVRLTVEIEDPAVNKALRKCFDKTPVRDPLEGITDFTILEISVDGPFSCNQGQWLDGFDRMQEAIFLTEDVEYYAEDVRNEFLPITVENFKMALQAQLYPTKFLSERLPEIGKLFSVINNIIEPSLELLGFTEDSNSLVTRLEEDSPAIVLIDFNNICSYYLIKDYFSVRYNLFTKLVSIDFLPDVHVIEELEKLNRADILVNAIKKMFIDSSLDYVVQHISEFVKELSELRGYTKNMEEALLAVFCEICEVSDYVSSESLRFTDIDILDVPEGFIEAVVDLTNKK